ncbi:MAG: Uma2 family endonuclease [Phormidesmis sp.]
MTYTLKRYQSYEEYLNAEELLEEKDYRLLDTGEVIELASEESINRLIAYALMTFIVQSQGLGLIRLLRRGDQELQVKPLGDRWVNRKPDLMLLKPEHLELIDKAIVFDMPPPAFVAEIVSPGGEPSVNYKRDYVWKREQYEWWQIPEYWIIDPGRAKITVLTLAEGVYKESAYAGDKTISSAAFPLLRVTADSILTGAAA